MQLVKSITNIIKKYKFLALALIISIVLVYYCRNYTDTQEEFLGMSEKGTKAEIRMKKAYENKENKINMSSISESDPRFKDRLYNYQILGSYNSCCGGDGDGVVSLEPLKIVIKLGARVLDFAIYTDTRDKTPVVGASYNDNNYLPSEYNYISVDDVFSTIKNYAMMNNIKHCQNSEDPLFLNLRIMSDEKGMLPNLAESLKNVFGNSLLSINNVLWRYSGENTDHELVEQPLLSLKNKVIVILHQKNNNFKEQGNKLYELSNFITPSRQFNAHKNQDIAQSHDIKEKMDSAQHSILLVTPDYDIFNKNLNAKIAYNSGCQMVLPHLQNPTEENAKYIIELHKKIGSAFRYKPKNLRYIPIPVKCPVAQSEKNSFGPKPLKSHPDAQKLGMIPSSLKKSQI